MFSVFNFSNIEPKGEPITSEALVVLEEVKKFLNIYDNEDDTMIQSFMDSALFYIQEYTGLTDELILAKAKSLRVALMLIVSDLYDNRGQQSVQFKKNLMLTSLLDLHSVNLI